MAFKFSGITAYHQQLREGVTNCSAAVAHYLQAIEDAAHLNAIVQAFAVQARERAARLDTQFAASGELLPLHGVIISLKDVFCYQGHPVTAASKMLEGFKSQFNATVVQRLLDAGAIIIGTTNCDEFAMGSTNENSMYGPVKNGANPGHVSGGSSGGAAVSVQAGLCMAALGSDTGGSVRQPADFCGVVGFKPTYGRLSRHGLIAYASSFDCVGILAYSVEDVAAIYDVIAGPDQFDSTAIQARPEPIAPAMMPAARRKYRLAYFPEAVAEGALDPFIGHAFLMLKNALLANGHQVEAVPFPLLDKVVPAYYVLTTAEASSNLSRYDGIRFGHRGLHHADDLTALYTRSRTEGFGPEVKRRIMLGTFVLSAGYYDAYYTRAQQVRRLIIERTTRIFKDFDAILLPVSPGTAPALGSLGSGDPVKVYMADIFTVFANLAGIPALAIPFTKHENGLPFGFQLMAASRQELVLCQLAQHLHRQVVPPTEVTLHAS